MTHERIGVSLLEKTAIPIDHNKKKVRGQYQRGFRGRRTNQEKRPRTTGKPGRAIEKKLLTLRGAGG